MLIEGEEEVGSINLEPFLVANKQELKADVALISDTGMWDIDTPAVTTRLRGMTYAEVTLKAANRDLHSGLYGGSALNPINALTKILGDLQDETRPHPVAGLLRSREAGDECSARAMGRAGVRREGVPWRHRPVATRSASAATPAWSGFGRGRPRTSTASGAAIPAPAARPSSRRRPPRRCRSAWCRTRIRPRCSSSSSSS